MNAPTVNVWIDSKAKKGLIYAATVLRTAAAGGRTADTVRFATEAERDKFVAGL